MPRRRSYYDIEIFRRTATWAEQIVWNDPVFQDYAGAPWEIGERMAIIDLFLTYLIENPQYRTLLKLLRAYLLQKKKAFFAGVIANQITMLAFLKGGKLPAIDAILNPKPRSETS